MPVKRMSRSTFVAWGIVGAGSLLVLILLAMNGQQLSASLLAPDISQDFRPLVRHQISQKHAYDDGSTFSENRGFTKEFTLGYLLSNRRTRQIRTMPLYSCANRREDRYVATTDRRDCRRMQSTYQLGHLVVEPAIEAATPLYRCIDTTSGDHLLTDDTTECTALASYNEPELLGYMAGAGHLPQRRLNEFCNTVAAECAAGRASAATCTAQTSFCKGPQ